MVLKVENLSKSFKGNKVLKNVSFQVAEKEIVAILGRSGAGKTTILKCINGLEKCDHGTIEIDHKYLCREENGKCIYPSKRELRDIRKNLGMVFQSFNLFPHMSVLENVIEAPINIFGVPKKEAFDKGMELLQRMQLEEKAYAYPFELSGGQKQRAAIARACALSPKIMCLDEPTSALDPELREGIAAIIEELARESMAVLIITHDMNFAKRVAQKIIFMENGQIVKEASKKEFFENMDDESIKKFMANG